MQPVNRKRLVYLLLVVVVLLAVYTYLDSTQVQLSTFGIAAFAVLAIYLLC